MNLSFIFCIHKHKCIIKKHKYIMQCFTVLIISADMQQPVWPQMMFKMLVSKHTPQASLCMLACISCSFRCQMSIQSQRPQPQNYFNTAKEWKKILSRCPSLLPVSISMTLVWNTSDVKHLLTFMSCERSGWMGDHYIQCQSPWPNPQ